MGEEEGGTAPAVPLGGSAGGSWLDLKSQLAFYGFYHQNFLNQLIHLVFVPVIAGTTVLWCTYTGPLLPAGSEALDEPWNRLLVPNLAAAVVLFYSTYYMYLDFPMGLAWAGAMGVPILFLANYVSSVYGTASWAPALGLHVLGWYMQLHPGHKIFERRKPALLDGLVQSFLTAPFFVFIELLFWLGFRKQLRAELEELILARTKALAQAKGGDKSGQDSTYTKLVASGE